MSRLRFIRTMIEGRYKSGRVRRFRATGAEAHDCFERYADHHTDLCNRGLPVVPIVARGAGFFDTKLVGDSLAVVATSRTRPWHNIDFYDTAHAIAEMVDTFADAAVAISDLPASNVVVVPSGNNSAYPLRAALIDCKHVLLDASAEQLEETIAKAGALILWLRDPERELQHDPE